MKFFTSKVLRIGLAFAAVLATGSFAKAQTFGLIDTGYYKCNGFELRSTGGLVLPDSSVMVIGFFSYSNERVVSSIAKVFPNGENDYSFDPGLGADNYINVIARQPDGKLIIAGDFVNYNGTVKNRIARINPNGSLDNTFNTGSGLNGVVYALHLQNDGKILLGGGFTTFNGVTANRIVRLNTDGSRDTTFTTGTGADSDINSISQQADGKIIVAGKFLSYNTDTMFRIARLNMDGTRDTTFRTPRRGANNFVLLAFPYLNNKIVIAGFFTQYDSTLAQRLALLNSDGSIDSVTFPVGTGFNNYISTLAIQPDGKILATGQFTNYKGTAINRIARINPDATRDNAFTPGLGLNLSSNSVFLNPDNKIYVAGTFTVVDSFSRIRFVRLLPNGKVDQTFQYESKLNGPILALGKQSTNKLIAAGSFTRYNDKLTSRIIRLNEDGTIDNTFTTGTGANGAINAVAVLPNDKIIIAGAFTAYNGKTINRIARLNANGTLDTTFTVGTGFNNTVNRLLLMPDGRIYAAGTFTAYNGITLNRIARLNSNGTLDNTFTIGTGFNNAVAEIVLQKNGKLIAGGTFTNYNGTAINRICRLDTTGVLDATFTVGTGSNNVVNAIAIDDTGRIYIGGNFTAYNGTTRTRIARLRDNGSIDSSYVATAAAVVNEIALIQGGVLIGGNFTTFNGVASNRIGFTNTTTGATNTQLTIGKGYDGAINVFLNDASERKTYIGGAFTGADVKCAAYLNRLINTSIDITAVPVSLCPGAITKVFFTKYRSFPVFNTFVAQLSDSSGSFTNAINIGTKSGGGTGTDSIGINIPFNTLTGSNYRIRIVSTTPADTSNLSRAIYIGPQQPFSITPSGPTTFCSGGTVQLSSVSGGVAYVWSNGATTQNITVTNSGTFTVSVTANNCLSVSNPLSVTVLASPDSSVSLSNYSLCAGNNSVTLNAAPGNSYAWSNGATGISTTVTTDDNYTLTVTAPSGCKADSTVAINFATLTSNLITAAGPTTVCANQSVTLTGLGGLTYNWSNGQSGQSITVNNSGAYSATASDGTCSTATNVINVTVNNLPSAAITTNGPDKLCVTGGTVTLQASPALSYNWSTGDTTSSTTVSSVNNYTLTVTDANNCSASGSYSVNVFAPADTLTPSGALTFCEGDSVTLAAATGHAYNWSNSASTAAITVNSSGTYRVTISDVSSGCQVVSESKTITVNALPAVSFQLPIDSICNTSSAITLNGGVPAGGAYSGTGVSGNNFNAATAPAGSNTLTYTFTDNNNCTASATDVITVLVCTGTNTVETDFIQVFPNPVKDVLYLQSSKALGPLKVYNLNGQLVREADATFSTQFTLSLSSLPAGIYVLRIYERMYKIEKAE